MKITHFLNNLTGKVDNTWDSVHDDATAPPTPVNYTPFKTHDESEICDYCKPVNADMIVAQGMMQKLQEPKVMIPTVSPDVIDAPPKYYTGNGKIDVIDFMTPQIAPEQMEGFFRMNIMKYLTRYDKKGTPVQDLEKAQDYMNMLVTHVKGQSPQ